MNQFSIKAAGAVGVLAVAASTCDPAHARNRDLEQPTTFVRVLQAVPGGPKIDFYVDGKKELNDYKFGGLSNYVKLPAGHHSFSLWSNRPARPILTGERSLRPAGFYTIAAYGEASRPRLLTFEDSGGSVGSNESRLTVFHLSPQSPPVEVLATTRSGGTYRLFNRLRFGQIRASYVPSTSTTLRVRIGGRTIKTINGFKPRPGQKYNAYLIGDIGQDFKVLLDVTAKP